MSIVRVGTTKKYADGWEMIFGGKKKTGKPTKAARKSDRKKRGRRK